MWLFVALALVGGQIHRVEQLVPTKQACLKLMESVGDDYRGLKAETGRLVSCKPVS